MTETSAARDGFGDRDERPILLVAGFPSERIDEADPVPARILLEIEEALLSFARAAFAADRQVVVPADREVAPLLASVAAEYGDPLRTESEEVARPLLGVALTAGRDRELELELARVPGVALLGPDGGPVAEADPGGEAESADQPLTIELVAGVVPAVGVGLGWIPRPRFDESHFLALGIPVQLLWPTASDPGMWATYGRMTALLRESAALWVGDRGERGEGEGERPSDGERWLPYPYLMQRMFGEEKPESMPG